MKKWKIGIAVIVCCFLIFNIGLVVTGKGNLISLLSGQTNLEENVAMSEESEILPEKEMMEKNVSAYVTDDTTDTVEDAVDVTKDIADTKEAATDIEEEYVPSMDKLLRTAIEPVGNTMYIWGGGWNEADDGAGIEAVSIGVSPKWEEYASKQDAYYNYRNTRYQIHDGLDCSGYIGWLVYNVMNTENGKEGYVMYACDMANTYASYGWGTYMTSGDYKPGDICSMSGHVWLCLGTCSDGSVLLVHSSPPGVRICGTKLPGGYNSQAVELATQIMSTHYKDWYDRYPDCSVNASFLTNSVKMQWDTSILLDENDLQNASGEEVAEYLFD